MRGLSLVCLFLAAVGVSAQQRNIQPVACSGPTEGCTQLIKDMLACTKMQTPPTSPDQWKATAMDVATCICPVITSRFGDVCDSCLQEKEFGPNQVGVSGFRTDCKSSTKAAAQSWLTKLGTGIDLNPSDNNPIKQDQGNGNQNSDKKSDAGPSVELWNAWVAGLAVAAGVAAL
ncbi:hypothetical protein HK104_002175 [Borealophlyctis nickersoniae]|nr:hypothetical protein HK104_002175 [Borealophlyctis nickersoniae]